MPLKSPADSLNQRARTWWQKQSPSRQDRFAALAPIFAVMLFMTAMAAAFLYLRYEEIDREAQAVRRDVEFAHQKLRLRLLEQQEQLMRMARSVSSNELDAEDFVAQAEALTSRYPELHAVGWIDLRKRYRAAFTSPSIRSVLVRNSGDMIKSVETETVFNLVRELNQPVFSQPTQSTNTVATLHVQVPLLANGEFSGVILGEYTLDGLMRYGLTAELASRYAVSFKDARDRVLVGNTAPARGVSLLLPWAPRKDSFEVPVAPIGNGLYLHAEGYRTSPLLVTNGLFWMVAGLSLMTSWMLFGTWRHSRRRTAAQRALLAETSFRRAMENSMLTGMRALDMQGRITYVNPAFCQMTQWSEPELVGRTPPFPYWPEADKETLMARLDDELKGRTSPGGFQVRVKRKNGTTFDARMYVSPLIDTDGHQSGWMTAMTDITEPNKIREQLAASYERFTTVLDALDAAVSVAPLGSRELVFANKMYRTWFTAESEGHMRLVVQAGALPMTVSDDAGDDDIDALAGLPTDEISQGAAENAELFIPELNKWLEVRSRYLTWVDGRLAQMVIATDITPRRAAEEQASTQADRAQTASRLITMGEMASSVAHELNQPLTAINNYCSGMVSRIKSEQITNEGLIEALEKTSKQAHRAGQIIQRIRNFVKRSEPNRVASDVATMVSEALELAEIELRRRSVRISPYLAARLPHLMVDPILIEQVLVNLLKNAGESIDLAQRPIGKRNVELRVVPKTIGTQSVVEFTVQDTGKGLAPEVMERLFEAFFSTKAEGMGIGLNLCRSIVESHQGRMQAQNLYNGTAIEGCVFSFWIPVSDVPTGTIGVT